jgi:hypothetical protein
MVLFTNGCSWTYGGGLKLDHKKYDNFRPNLVWPKQLGDLLNASNTINLAVGCGSNQRIVRTTHEWFIKNYDPSENYIAIIQWTEFSRYEYYVTKSPLDDFENNPDKWAKVKTGIVLSNHEENLNTALKRSGERFKTYTEIEGTFNHLRDCTSLAYLFDKLGIRYYFWNFNHFINNPMFTTYFNDFPYLDSRDWEYRRVSPTDAHPSIQGHREIAKIIHNLIDSQ